MDKTTPPVKNGRPDPIRIKKITLATNIDVPGQQAARVLMASPPDAPENRLRLSIEYRPWVGQYVIEGSIPGRETPDRVHIERSQVLSFIPYED